MTKDKLYIIYEFGLYFNSGDSCTIETRKKYGFVTAWGTCIPSKKTERINEKNEILLEKRNGKNWRDKYNTDLVNCGDKRLRKTR